MEKRLLVSPRDLFFDNIDYFSDAFHGFLCYPSMGYDPSGIYFLIYFLFFRKCFSWDFIPLFFIIIMMVIFFSLFIHPVFVTFIMMVIFFSLFIFHRQCLDIFLLDFSTDYVLHVFRCHPIIAFTPFFQSSLLSSSSLSSIFLYISSF